MTADMKFIKAALTLARKGIGSVEPNPAVGCIIVKNNKIIGKGWHKKYGGPHAEINALADCKKKGNCPADAIMYVTLEPCCHFGKTPPCVNAVIKAGIKKVIAAIKDPTKKVAGKGFEILKKAGIKVICGVCEKEAEQLNAPFFKFAKTKKPYVIIKWAQSKDGFLSRTDKKRWISNSASRKDVQNIRKRAQAILVGINTVLEDDPMLTVRPDDGKERLRVVLDSQLRIPQNCNLIKTANKNPVCIFTTIAKKIEANGVEIIKVGKYKNGINLKTVLAELRKRNIQQILVEGGEKIITSFLKQKLADEIIIYTSTETLGKKGKTASSQTMKSVYNFLTNHYTDKKRLYKDTKLTGFMK